MTEQQVINAWMNGEEAECGSLKTDGFNLYSYQLRIGGVYIARKKMKRYRVDYRNDTSSLNFLTKRHIDLVKKATRHYCPWQTEAVMQERENTTNEKNSIWINCCIPHSDKVIPVLERDFARGNYTRYIV